MFQSRARAVRLQDPRYLVERSPAVEPVEGLSDEDRIGARIGQWHVLGGPLERTRLRCRASELLLHRGQRLDRDHLVEAPRQVPGQLAGTRGKVDDDASPLQTKLADERIDRLQWIARTAALVFLRCLVEGSRELGVLHWGSNESCTRRSVEAAADDCAPPR